MIEFKKGDLLEAFRNKEIAAICHGCNLVCSFGAGIAAQIKNQFPQAFIVDCNTLTGDKRKLGTFTYAHYPEGYIFNLYAQKYINRIKPYIDQCDYEALDRGLNKLYKFCKDHEIKSLGFPDLIFCGLCCGDRQKVLKNITEVFKDFDVKIYKFK